jgi:hypothetical protein
MTFYYPQWVKEKEENTGKKSGPKKGFTDTTGKTTTTYEKYVTACGDSREMENSTSWGDRLNYMTKIKDQEERSKREADAAEKVRTIVCEKDTSFMKYTQLSMRRRRNKVNEEFEDDTDTATATASDSGHSMAASTLTSTSTGSESV